MSIGQFSILHKRASWSIIPVMDTLREHLVKASQKQKEKYTSEDFSKWGSKGRKNFLSKMTKEEKTIYFRNIRNGIKVSSK